VHKVGDHYYVEDGHHRVSIAQALGMAYIQAKVWEYPSQVKQTRKCETVECTERNSVKKYVTATD
jgi:ParB-like chromosome segregation protein Spo0J